MNINPANSAAVQFSMAHELDHLGMGNCRGSINPIVSRQEFLAAPPVTDEQLAGNQFVRRDFIGGKQPAEFFRVRWLVGQKTNPNRTVDQHHLRRRRSHGRVFTEARHICRFGFAPTKAPEDVHKRRASPRPQDPDERSRCPSKRHKLFSRN